jgi:succinate dehydrogenase flavin-adding protein (antitoxin of CptAB toxin-antitoxin module)
MSISGLLLQKLAQKQLEGLPPEQRDMFMHMLEKDPNLFVTIAKEVQEKMTSGMEQMAAAQAVFASHETELRALMQDSK